MNNRNLPAQSCGFLFRKRVKSFLLYYLFFSAAYSIINAQDDPIRLNQVGYYPNSTKLAIVTGKVQSPSFCIVTSDGRDTVYDGSLSLEKKSAFSSTITRMADFTDFQQTGSFVLRIDGLNSILSLSRSKIDVYHELGKAVLKGFYFQRSSIPLDGKYAGKWQQRCHVSG